jgi:hypothetical protein
MTREQALGIVTCILNEAGIRMTIGYEAASKIADILMESAKPKVPFMVGDVYLILNEYGYLDSYVWAASSGNQMALAQGNIAPDTPEGRKALELEARRRAFRAKPRKEGERVWVNWDSGLRNACGVGAGTFHLADILGLTWATKEEAEANQKEAMELFWEGM